MKYPPASFHRQLIHLVNEFHKEINHNPELTEGERKQAFLVFAAERFNKPTRETL